jgi:release factor glutamine methyltransferase
MRLLAPPGVFRPRSDTWLLAGLLAREPRLRGARVLDLCTGTGALGIVAAIGGARTVTAVDISRRSVHAARLNARLNGARMRVLRGDLFDVVARRRFDLIAANPPYLPSTEPQLPRSGASRAWDAGIDGRAILDRIVAEAPLHLTPGGALWLVHSSVCDARVTMQGLTAAGLEPAIVQSSRGPLGPLLRARAEMLAERRLIDEGLPEEELVVIRAVR